MSFTIFLKTAFTVAAITFQTAVPISVLADERKTPEEFAKQYIAAFNKKDKDALVKMRLPVAHKSPFEELMDNINDVEMSAGTQYTKFEIAPVDWGSVKPEKGPDGILYKPNIKPTDTVKFTAVTKDGSASTSFPIGQKDGIYYMVSPVEDLDAKDAKDAPPAASSK